MRTSRWPAVLGLAGATLLAGTRAGAQSAEPAVTLLYQNFPNPFPTASAATTCIWFDLAADGSATLDVYDLRGNRVRRLFPTGGESAFLRAGRYGRGAGGSGCDGRFVWDGSAEDGRRVPSGIYLLRLRTHDAALVRKIVVATR